MKKKYHRINKDKLDQIIILYSNGHGVRKIGKLLDYSHSSISKILKRNGIKVKTSVEMNRKYFCNESYFSKIDSYEKAYWLGWLWSDGNVYKGVITIPLQRRDRYILEKFKSNIQSTHVIKDFYSKIKEKSYEMSVFRIYSRQMADDLAKLGLVERKGKTNNIPIVPDEFLPSFILGEFEGDGSIGNNKKYFSGKIVIFDTNAICSFLKTSLDKIFNRDVGYVKKSNYSKIFTYLISKGKDVVDFYNLIYQNAPFVLTRKKEKFDIVIDKIKHRKDHSTSKFRGVSWLKQYKKFEVMFSHNGKRSRAYYDNELDAAKKYDEFAKKALGNKATTNF